MKILLVNDDGIHAPGLRAMRDVLETMGDVQVVAPLVEQSGVSHRITYLHPIMVREIFDHGEHYGWAVDGSPADCTKLGVLEFCDGEPDLIVSGINSGSNVGINTLYSGTVAAAIEGAFFGITSIAVSLRQEESIEPDYPATAEYAEGIIRQILDQFPDAGSLWTINFPPSSPQGPQGVRPARMCVNRRSDRIEKRSNPRGRPYFWSGLDPIDSHTLSPGEDVKVVDDGYVAVTPLHFDLTEDSLLKRAEEIDWTLPSVPADE